MKVEKDNFWVLVSTALSMVILSLFSYLFLNKSYGILVSFFPLFFYILRLEAKLSSKAIIGAQILFTLIIVIIS